MMKQKTIIKTLASITAVMAMLPMLGGCGQTQNATPTQKATTTEENKAISASEAFSEKGIWYFGSGSSNIGKDTVIDAMFVSDGKGNLTIYQVPDEHSELFKISDLRGKKDDEIIEFAGKNAQKKLDEYSAKLKEQLPKVIGSLQSYLSDADAAPDKTAEAWIPDFDDPEIPDWDALLYYVLQDEYGDYLPGTINTGGIRTYQDLAEYCNKQIESYNKEIEKLENNSKYTPEKVKYEFIVKSNDSGNVTQDETLRLKDYATEDYPNGWEIPLGAVALPEPEVYDMHFVGFINGDESSFLIRNIAEETPLLMLDQPDTKAKNVIVDPEEK
ncbi:hypothetical protein GCM10007377_08560 [Galliscardovia ingluviei]|uniref:Uncharacterized protein n=1 Tax=Galliscardovia ingluviei TaxID=1769422 RepID=A0A8J3AGK4_9BIFI|nr:hypothetical protein [Galliscardovia ingluviei]GGI13963.1 hypothetical protein GCM10007377_08560 [Galliscardovia ingluviei]